jgi:hypothetical protein
LPLVDVLFAANGLKRVIIGLALVLYNRRSSLQ